MTGAAQGGARDPFVVTEAERQVADLLPIEVDPALARATVERVPFWFHTFGLNRAEGIYTPGAARDHRYRVSLVPKDFAGMSVLDVGTFDGFYAFLAERRGAERVVAVDNEQYRHWVASRTDARPKLKVTVSGHLQLHPEVANALEAGVRNRDFWLWLRAYRDDDAPIDTGELCERVEAWLAGLEREVTRARVPAEFVYETETFEVRLTAAPKGDSTRGGGALVRPPVTACSVQ